MNITKGKKQLAQKVIIYGPEGIGKSTLAAQFPDPLFIDTEGSTSNMDVARFDAPSSFTMLLQQIKYVRDNMPCKTIVIDTADWAEKLCIEEFCAKKQITGIEDIGYGKGYVYVAEDFGKMLNLLEEVKLKGINVVITAHAQMSKFEQPDELGAYDRWSLKLQKKTAPMLKEWADMVLFCNYKTIVVNVDGQGAQKGKNKAQGGKRVIYTQHHNCWDAKNRHGLPEEIPMEYAAISHCIPTSQNSAPTSQITPPTQEPIQQQEIPFDKVENTNTLQPASTLPTEMPTNNGGATNNTPTKETKTEKKKKSDITGVPPKLAQLMQANNVSKDDITNIVTLRGYFPAGTPIENYPEDFIDGCLIGAWEQVYGMIRDQKIKNGEFVTPTDGEQMELNQMFNNK